MKVNIYYVSYEIIGGKSLLNLIIITVLKILLFLIILLLEINHYYF